MGDRHASEELLSPISGLAGLRLEAAAELNDLGYFEWDLETSRFSLSPRAADILGIAPCHPAAFSSTQVRRLPIVAKAKLLRSIRRFLAGGPGPSTINLTVRTPDGDRRHIRAALRCLKGLGRQDVLTGALVDQTEQRRSEAELRATLTTVPSAMIVIDEQGLVRAFSAAAEAMFGRRAADMLGQPIELLMPEPYRSAHAGYLTRYLTTGDARIIGQSRIMNAVRADGTEFPIELWVGDASTDTERLFTGFIRDHSVRFETEAKLQTLQNDLVHVARLSAVGELSMALAHELNQPLGTLVNHLSTADFLARKGDSAQAEHLVRSIGSATDQAMRAGAILKRLRSFIEKGEADKRIEPVEPIVEEAAALVSSALRKKGIDFAIKVDVREATVLADRVQIQQVLFNLLRNAMEALAAPCIARPKLRVVISQTNVDNIDISVIDNGLGITPERAATLFTPFSTEKPGGMGVGLSISRRIMEAHGGHLIFAPAPGGGAQFTLVLPTAVEEPADA